MTETKLVQLWKAMQHTITHDVKPGQLWQIKPSSDIQDDIGLYKALGPYYGDIILITELLEDNTFAYLWRDKPGVGKNYALRDYYVMVKESGKHA